MEQTTIIQFRAPIQLREQASAHAKRRGTNLSELIRALLEKEIGYTPERKPTPKPKSTTPNYIILRPPFTHLTLDQMYALMDELNRDPSTAALSMLEEEEFNQFMEVWSKKMKEKVIETSQPSKKPVQKR